MGKKLRSNYVYPKCLTNVSASFSKQTLFRSAMKTLYVCSTSPSGEKKKKYIANERLFSKSKMQLKHKM